MSSVAMAVRLLKCFSEGEAEIGVTNLSRRLGVAKSTVYRLATTLVSEGLLEQNPETEKYRLGISLFGLGALVRQRMNVATDARPLLFHLREATGETVHLAILEREEIIYVLNLESNHAIRMRADLGARKPAYCTAEGRAMLAFQPRALIDEIFAHGLVARTARTDTDPRHLLDALEEVRQKGYATEDEQSELGMRSVAAPIRNSNGRVIAAVGVAGPMQRISDEALASFAPLVVDAAQVISARLGYQSLASF
ncbi:MAG: IclR family transcriptional regulator [Beijerinckiaceae bacterium]|nr:IclR family transcriptional regulator [Beijerinckiaceae bacterium]